MHLRPIRLDDDARAARALRAALERVDLPAVLLAGARARPRAQLEHLTHRRLRHAHGARRRARRRDRRGRPLRPRAGRRRGRGRVHRRRTTSRVAGSATIMLEHLAAVAAHARHRRRSSPRRCRTTGGCSACSATRATRSCASSPTASCTSRSRSTRPRPSQAVQDEREQISEARSVAPAARAAIDRGDRRGPAAGHDRPRGVPQPARRRVRRARSTRSTRTPTSSRACSAYPTILDVPDAVDLAVVAVPAAAVAEVVERVRGQGRARADRHQRRVRRASASARDASSELVELARRHGMRLVGPELHGRREHRTPTCSMNATFAPVPARARAGSAFASQSGALGIELLGQAASLGLGISTLRVGGQQGRRQRQRPPAVLGARPRDRRDPALPRVVREPAQVRAARPPRRRAASRSSR